MKIDHWKGRRFFALYDDNDELVAVFVYRKGAAAVKTRLTELEEMIARLESERVGVGDDNPTLLFIESARRVCRSRERQKVHASALPLSEKRFVGQMRASISAHRPFSTTAFAQAGDTPPMSIRSQ